MEISFGDALTGFAPGGPVGLFQIRSLLVRPRFQEPMSQQRMALACVSVNVARPRVSGFPRFLTGAPPTLPRLTRWGILCPVPCT